MATLVSFSLLVIDITANAPIVAAVIAGTNLRASCPDWLNARDEAALLVCAEAVEAILLLVVRRAVLANMVS